MMGPRQADQAALFYEFSLERHVPASHLLGEDGNILTHSALRLEWRGQSETKQPDH